VLDRVRHFGPIIIIKRKDLGGVMSKDCKDILQMLKQWQNAIAMQRS